MSSNLILGTTLVAMLPSRAWDACADPEMAVDEDEPIIVGFDGSFSGESTGLVACTVELPHRLWVLAVWEKPPDVSTWRSRSSSTGPGRAPAWAPATVGFGAPLSSDETRTRADHSSARIAEAEARGIAVRRTVGSTTHGRAVSASLRRGSASGTTTTHRPFRRWPEERTGRRGSAGSTSGSTRAGFDLSGPSGTSLADHESGLVRTDSDPRLAPGLRSPQGRMSSNLILGTTFGSASTPAFGVTYAGFMNGETAAALGRSPSITPIAPVSRP